MMPGEAILGEETATLAYLRRSQPHALFRQSSCDSRSTRYLLTSNMSFAVLRGEPTAAQRFLDERLRAAGAGSLPRLLYHCMRTQPHNVHMINGASGESFTNEQILRRAIPLARALIARRVSGAAILCMMRNHEQLVSLYYAALMAGAAPFLLDPHSTQRELAHFLPLVCPRLAVCDADRRADVSAALAGHGSLSSDDLLTHDQLEQFATGYDDDLENFEPVPVAKNARAVLLPTSGSTGLPKAAEITHDGLLMHLPLIWSNHTRFPRPTERAMFMSTAQWMTFTNMLTTCPVYEVTLIISPDKSLPTVLRIMETHKPTWLLQTPGAAAALIEAASPRELVSLRHVVVTGAPPPPTILHRLQQLVPTAIVHNSYGITETHGYVTLPVPDTPISSVGKVLNIFEYKLVDEAEKEVALGEKGELFLRSDCIIKRYVNNEEAHRETVAAGGWWRTGDVFTEGARGNLFFIERKKFWFKHLNYHISPEELENVISEVPGVQQVVVTDSERGAVAAVVCDAGANVSREDIHRAVDEAVMEYKRLRGGIAFVTSLPRTHSGKLHRADCAALLARLVDSGECW